MKQLFDFLDGNKTNIGSIAVALINIALYLKWIDMELYLLLMGLFGGGTVMALRSGVKKSSPK